MDTKGIGVVLVLALFGLIVGVVGFVPVYQHNVAVQEGEPTSGVIQSTEIQERTNDDEREYSPVVVYEYQVDGETYDSENTFPGDFQRWRGSRMWAEDVVSQYSPGQEVEVHYMPHDHAESYVRNDGPPSRVLPLIYALIAIGGGGWLVRVGFRRWKQRQLIVNTPTERVRSLSIGRSELTGTAVTEDLESIRAPFSGDDCLVAKYEIKEYDEDEDDDSGGSWRTVESDVLHVPFYVDDGTGSVLVEPHEDAVFDLDPEDWTTTYVDSSDRGPEPIRQFVESSTSVGFPAHSSGKDNDRKYRQNLIRPDESVYVFGNVHPRDGADPGAPQEDRLVIRKDPDSAAGEAEMYLISDDSEKNLTNRRRWALWRGPVGGLFVTVGVAFLLGMYGPGFGVTLPVLF